MAASQDLPKLRAKHQRFVNEYLVDLNGTQAAIRAGYSEKSARFTAAELLAREDVQGHIAALQARAAEDAGVSRARVLKELAAVAFSDIRNVLAWCALSHPETGEKERLVVVFRDSGDIPPEAAAAIASVEQGLQGFKMKMHPKMPALLALAKHLRLLDEDDARNNERPAKLTPENIGEVIERARLYAVAAGRKTPTG